MAGWQPALLARILGAALLAVGCTREPPKPPGDSGTPPSIVTDGGKTATTGKQNSGNATRETRPPKENSPSEPIKPPASKIELTGEARDQLAKLASADQKVKDSAEVWLENSGDRANDYLIAGLGDSRGEVRVGAAYGLLGRFSQFEPRVVQALLAALADDHERVRSIAISAVTQMDADMARPALPQLVVILGSVGDKPHVRAQAARVLGTLGEEAFAPLQSAIASETDRAVRTALLGALVQAAPRGEDAAAVLGSVVAGDPDPALQRLAASRLGSLGAQAAGASEELAAVLGGKDDRLRQAAAEALARIGPAAVPALAEQANSKNKRAQLPAIETLGQFGPAAKAALPALKQAAGSSDKEISEAATIAIRLIEAK